jgi:hypothetical protein
MAAYRVSFQFDLNIRLPSTTFGRFTLYCWTCIMSVRKGKKEQWYTLFQSINIKILTKKRLMLDGQENA